MPVVNGCEGQPDDDQWSIERNRHTPRHRDRDENAPRRPFPREPAFEPFEHSALLFHPNITVLSPFAATENGLPKCALPGAASTAPGVRCFVQLRQPCYAGGTWKLRRFKPVDLPGASAR